MAAQSKLQLVIEGIDKASGPLNKVSKSVNEMGDASKSSGSRLGTLGKTALKATAALAGVAFIAKKTFEAMKEGAAVRQTGQSFEFLIKKVGASTDLLDQLRTASKGTISDMDLMSSTSTLLAGAQGDLATELAASTPRLLEIAKAAQKLNPALGSTTFLYDSLALGVKRASPMILDNLGLTIRIGEANEAYAEELGKTVAELTAAEMKQALLNETLRAGNVLIEQAGGTTESATDSYIRLGAEWENATDTGKAMLHDVFSPLIGLVAEGVAVIGDQVEALEEATLAEAALIQAAKDGIITMEEANLLINKATYSSYTFAEALTEVEAAMWKQEMTDSVSRAVEEFEKLEFELWRTTAATRETEKVFQDMGFSMDITARKQEDVAFSTNAGTDAFEFMAGVVGDFNEQELEELNIRLGSVSTRLKDQLAVAMGETSQEIVDMQRELRVLRAELEKSWSAAKQAEWVALSIEIDQATTSFQELAGAAAAFDASADYSKYGLGGLTQAMKDFQDQTEDTTGTIEEWAAIEDDLALAIGRKNERVIDAERALRKLEREVSENVRSFEDAKEEILLAKLELHEANEEWAESNKVIKDNTAILKDNTEERERAAGISDAYAKLIGRENEATLALRDTIEMQTEAYEELGLESGFTEESIAELMLQLDDMRDVLRDSTRDSDLFADSLDLIGEGADKTTKSVSRMRTELIAAGGDWWATASNVQVAEEHARLSGGGGGDTGGGGAGGGSTQTGDLLPGQTSPDVGKGDTGQWGVEYGDQEDGWNEMFGEWQPGAAGRSEEEQATDVIKDMIGRHGFNPDAPQGWAMDFLRTGGGPGSGTGLIGRGFSDDAITAALKNAGGQHGLDMIVPPGFNNDNFAIGATSGERVTVTPAHMMGGGGGGLTVGTINVYGVQTASALYEEIVKAARQRGKVFAKVM